MKKVMGGLKDGELCTATNGTYYASICIGGYYLNDSGQYEWASSQVSPIMSGYDPSQPCESVCQGICHHYYACDDQFDY